MSPFTHPKRAIAVMATLSAADIATGLRHMPDADRRDFLEILAVELDTDAFRLLEEYMEDNRDLRFDTTYCQHCKRLTRRVPNHNPADYQENCEHCHGRLQTKAELIEALRKQLGIQP